jgi:hypothetical protein
VATLYIPTCCAHARIRVRFCARECAGASRAPRSSSTIVSKVNDVPRFSNGPLPGKGDRSFRDDRPPLIIGRESRGSTAHPPPGNNLASTYPWDAETFVFPVIRSLSDMNALNGRSFVRRNYASIHLVIIVGGFFPPTIFLRELQDIYIDRAFHYPR